MFQCGRPILAAAVNLRQRVITRRHPRLIPDGFVKSVIRFVVASEIAQRQAKIVKWFAVMWVWIAQCLAFDGAAEMLFCLRKFTAPEMPQAHRVVAARIQRV